MAALVVAAGVCYSCSREPETLSLQSCAAEERIAEEESAGVGIPADGQTEATEESREICYVHICGAVVNPGVYEVDKGQRIHQVVEQAGGYTREAAADYLNLAAPVTDGMKLVVPTREELLTEPGQSLYGTAAVQGAEAAGDPARVNLNTATKEQLMGLSGIGEARAGDIIRYREDMGGFQKIEDIMKIPGIKDAAFEKIKDKITV